MKKEEFLHLLKSKLDVLEPKEVEDILEEYENHIDEKMKEGMKEKEAIEDFGDIDELAKEILSAYKISDKYVNKQDGFEEKVNHVIDKIVEFFQDVAHSLTEQKGEDILRVVVKLCLVLVFVALMRVPFFLFELLGSSVFSLLPGALENAVVTLWKIIIGFAYFGFSIFVIYYAVKNLIIDSNNKIVSTNHKTEKPLKTKNESTSKKSEKVVREEVVDKEPLQEKKSSNGLGEALLMIVKVLVTLCTIPFLFALVGLYIALGVLICLAFQGVYMVSILIILFGLCIIGTSVLTAIYHVTWKGSETK